MNYYTKLDDEIINNVDENRKLKARVEFCEWKVAKDDIDVSDALRNHFFY